MTDWSLMILMLRRMLRNCYITSHLDVNRQSLYRWERGVIPSESNQERLLELAHKHLDDVELLRCGIVTPAMACQRKNALNGLARNDAEFL